MLIMFADVRAIIVDPFQSGLILTLGFLFPFLFRIALTSLLKDEDPKVRSKVAEAMGLLHDY